MIKDFLNKVYGSGVVCANLRGQRNIPYVSEEELWSLRDARLRQIVKYAAARYEDRLIAVAWATPHRINMSPYVSLVMPLPDNSIYFYESFTEPGFRGLSIQVALCAHMMRYFGAKDFQRAVTGVVPENEPSRRVYERCGFQPYGMIRFVMVGPYRRLLPAAFSVHEQQDDKF